jgi:flagellar assembly protein FliH
MSKIIPDDDSIQSWDIPDISDSSAGFGSDLDGRGLSADAKAKLEAIKNNAKKQGFEEGLAAAKNLIDQYGARLNALFDSLAKPMEQMSDKVETELVDLSVAIARQIVRRELKIDPGQVVAVVKEALSVLPAGSQNVHVYLHPDDATLVREIIPANINERKWNVVEDPIITHGGCRVETDSSQVDATIESRVAEIAAEIMGGERTNDRQ